MKIVCCSFFSNIARRTEIKMDKILLVAAMLLLQPLIIQNVFSLHLPADQMVADRIEEHNLNTGVKVDQFEGPTGSQNYYDAYYDHEDEDEPEFCLICHDYLPGHSTVELKCGHPYHLECCRYYRHATGQFNSCFLCGGEPRTKDDQEVVEILNALDRKEMLRLKLKMGLMAGLKSKPLVWESAGEKWYSTNKLFHGSEEERMAMQRYFE